MTGKSSKPKIGLMAMAAAAIGSGATIPAGRRVAHIMHPHCERAIKRLRQLAVSRKPSSVMSGKPHSNRKCPHHPPRLTKTQLRRAKRQRQRYIDHSHRLAKSNRKSEKAMRRRRMHLERLAFGRRYFHKQVSACATVRSIDGA